MTLIGTRPELIRLCLIIPKLDMFCDHVLVHTGQNYDANLNDVFMEQLSIRRPDYNLGATGSFGEQLAIIMRILEKIILKEKPDRLLVLGDTNSSLGAIMAKRMGVKVFHMEAGNRCYDDHVPEEVNRRLIDHSSDILLPYTERSRQNLLAEGIEGRRIYVTGNPIKEVLDHYTEEESNKWHPYYLVTLHRQENVDDPIRLKKFVDVFNRLDKHVIWSVHPRTRNRLIETIPISNNVELMTPLGFKEFIGLERSAYCVLTDSGTVQEECCIFGVPCVTLRDTTERPETIEVGSNFISGTDHILKGIEVSRNSDWTPPPEYLVKNVSDTVVRILLSI